MHENVSTFDYVLDRVIWITSSRPHRQSAVAAGFGLLAPAFPGIMGGEEESG